MDFLKIFPIRIISIVFTIYIEYRLLTSTYSHALFFLWIISIVLFLYRFASHLKFKFNTLFTRKIVLLCVILFLPIFVRILHFDLNRIHGDDIMTAYFSATEDFRRLNLFSGIPSRWTDWEAQFAPLFFLLQRIFFTLFGANLLTIKLSILPYVMLTSIMLYLIAKDLIDKKTAYITIFIYSFFAFSIYIETIGLWIVSGTAIFVVFFYFSIQFIKFPSADTAAFMGVSCGFCLLFYFSAYIAIPLLLLAIIWKLATIRKKGVLYAAVVAFAGFLIVTLPFITMAFTTTNYFIQRSEQMTLLPFSPTRLNLSSFQNSIGNPLLKNTAVVFSSLYQNGIGGHGGVNFGHLALFDRFSLILLITGFVGFIILVFKKPVLLFILIAILLSFVPMIFSLPPPAYHRASTAIPLFQIISALPFSILFSVKKIPRMIAVIVSIVILSLYVLANESYIQVAVTGEKYHPLFQATEYANKTYPHRSIHCAAYPGFICDKLYFFSRWKTAISYDVDYHDTYLKNFNRNEKYVYLVTFAKVFTQKFKDTDKNGKVIYINDELVLFVN